MKLVIATKNKNKIREMEAVFGDVFPPGLELLDLGSAQGSFCWPEVVEDRLTFEGNAIKKAVELAQHAGQTVLAEDSGLVVDALDGAPGVFSARYAGPQRRDADNNALLVRSLEERGAAPPHTARYVAVVALAMFEDDPTGSWLLERLRARCPRVDGEPSSAGTLGVLSGEERRCHVIWWRGTCAGEIRATARGEGGFGYDPHFFVPGFDRMMAELSLDQKGAISHRRRALDAMARALEG